MFVFNVTEPFLNFELLYFICLNPLSMSNSTQVEVMFIFIKVVYFTNISCFITDE